MSQITMGVENHMYTTKSIYPEVTHTTSAQILLAKTHYMVVPYSKDMGKYNASYV